jgi:FixJ family two-component response regulator
MEQPLIAIVDDDESVRDATERLMRSAGFSAETFSRGADFLSSPGLSRTACLVTDLNMPGMSGFDLHRRLQSLGRSIPTVLITGQPNENVRTQALSLGIICYLPKPFRDDDLIDSIHSKGPDDLGIVLDDIGMNDDAIAHRGDAAIGIPEDPSLLVAANLDACL